MSRMRHPAHVVERARTLKDRGYTPTEVRGHLLDEGINVNLWTLIDWLNFTNRRK